MEKPEKIEQRKYFRSYKVEFGEQINHDDADALIFEGYMVVAEKKDKHAHKEKKKDKKAEKELEKVKNDPMTGILLGTLSGQSAGLDQPPPPKKKDVQEVLYAVDRELNVLVILVKGQKGEQHKIF